MFVVHWHSPAVDAVGIMFEVRRLNVAFRGQQGFVVDGLATRAGL